jgi:deoxynucleoside triphosphate triphosphohydrolase SAMHD1
MKRAGKSLDMNTRLIADPTHGMIRVDGLITYLIDRPEFQRLRNIQQLGLCSFVYPTANHNRFQHSLGTYHMARMWLESLRTQKEFEITEEEALCVYIAALYHDIGHGPYSHFWDGVYVKRKAPSSKSHEEIGILIFRKMRKEEDFQKKWKEYDMEDKHFEIIEDFINGNYDCKELPDEKKFLTMIVSNKKAEIDVDKWDYLMRDSYYTCDSKIDLGVPRFREWLTFHRNDSGYWNTAVRDKDFINVAAIFYHRHRMHRQVYQHKTVKAIEEMLYDALVCVESELSEMTGLKFFEEYTEENIDSFLALTDDLFWRIVNGTFSTPEGKRGQMIVQRILKRDLYKLLTKKFLPKKDITTEQITEVTKELCLSGYDSTKICVTKAYFSLAGNMSNPLEDLIVLDKRGKPVSRDQISPMIQLESEPEIEIRLYSKCSAIEETEKQEIISKFEEFTKDWKKSQKVEKVGNPSL